MKNNLKVFVLIASIIAVCSAMICYIINHNDTEDENPMFI